MAWTAGANFTIPAGWTAGTDFVVSGDITGQASAQTQVTTHSLGQAAAALEVTAYASGSGAAQLAITAHALGQAAAQTQVDVNAGDILGQASAQLSVATYALGQAASAPEVTAYAAAAGSAPLEIAAHALGQASAQTQVTTHALGQATAALSIDVLLLGQSQAQIAVTTHALGQALAGLSVTAYAHGQAAAPLSIDVFTLAIASSSAGLAIITHAVGQASVQIEITLVEPAYQASAALSVAVYALGQASAVLSVTVYAAGANGLLNAEGLWGVAVTLNGVDVSASLTGRVSIDAEESAAMIAEFTLLPNAGPIALTQWVRAPVSISYVQRNADGSPRTSWPLFSGLVDVPRYEVSTRLTTFQCTDNLQAKFEASSRTDIDAIVGGHWSKFVFDERADNWTYAQDRLSTRPYSLDANVNGRIVLTPWAAKAVPDFTIGAGDILDGSTVPDLGHSRAVTNQVEIKFQYRYELLRERRVHFGWEGQNPLQCDWFLFGGTFPTFQTLIDAVHSSGWSFFGQPSFTSLPLSRIANCGTQIFGWVNSDASLVMGAGFTAARKYLETITEEHAITVRSPQSIERLGTISDEVSYSMAADYGKALAAAEETVEAAGSYRANLGGSQAVTNAFTYRRYKEPAAGAGLGDFDTDLDALAIDGDRADFGAALITAQHIARTAILRSMRSNSVSAQTLIAPAVTRAHTVEIALPEVQARGKVRRVQHEFVIEAGSALSTIEIAVSRVDAVGLPPIESAIVAPAAKKPATESADFSPQQTLKTWLGGRFNQVSPTGGAAGPTPPFSDTLFGWLTNYERTEAGAPAYPQQLRVQMPSISDTNTQPQTVETSQTVTVAVPDELLLMEA